MMYKYEGTVFVDGLTVEVCAEAEGFYCSGDSFGYGCEPPDEDFEITEVNIKRAYLDCPEEPSEITEELKADVKCALYDKRFEEA